MRIITCRTTAKCLLLSRSLCPSPMSLVLRRSFYVARVLCRAFCVVRSPFKRAESEHGCRYFVPVGCRVADISSRALRHTLSASLTLVYSPASSFQRAAARHRFKSNVSQASNNWCRRAIQLERSARDAASPTHHRRIAGTASPTLHRRRRVSIDCCSRIARTRLRSSRMKYANQMISPAHVRTHIAFRRVTTRDTLNRRRIRRTRRRIERRYYWRTNY